MTTIIEPLAFFELAGRRQGQSTETRASRPKAEKEELE